MVDDCTTLSFISKQLEALPLSDYFFPKKSEQNINKDLFHVKTNTVVPKPLPTTWSFDFSKTFIDQHLNEDFSKGTKTKNPIEMTPSNNYNNIKKGLKRCQTSSDFNVENLTKYDTDFFHEEEPVTVLKQTTTKEDISKTEVKSVRGLTPVYSDSLPTQSSAVKKSPTKRKRSSDESLSYGDISFSRSCDLEVHETRFCDIQRTLSFDEELLRCDEEIATFTSRSTLSARRYRSRSRPSIRLTCKSQPSSFENSRIVQPRARKIKVIQLKPDCLKKNEMKDSATIHHCSSLFPAKNEIRGDVNVFRPINFPHNN